jgi:DNA-binding Lrp family transcriptional regulator
VPPTDDDSELVDLAIRSKLGFAPERRGRPKALRGRDAGVDVDDVDLRIIRALNKNARKSFREIARELDLALSTVSNRVKHLEDAGVIRGYVPVVDAGKLGFDLSVVVGVKISPGKLMDVQQRIARHPRVVGVFDVTGEWDSLIIARFQDREDLNAFIKDVLNSPHVERTATQLVLNTVKDEKRVIM